MSRTNPSSASSAESNDVLGVPDHYRVAVALQKWIHTALLSGWNPVGETPGRWTREDNEAVAKYGFAILQLPNSPLYDVFSLVQNQSPTNVFRLMIKRVGEDSLFAKAVGLLSAQRLTYPNQKFMYAED